jgi:hypothetical protein
LNLDKLINNLSQRLSRFSETSSNTNCNDGIKYWEGKKIIPLDQWLQIKKDYTLQAALRFFPDDHPHYGLRYILDNIENPSLKEEADKWYSEYEDLMEHRKNPVYGRRKCFRCLLSPDREEAAIFIGINKVISRTLDSEGVSIYPCKVLNRFACPYDEKITKDIMEDGITQKADVDYLFYLSEIAFAVELALTKAQEEGSVFRIKSAEDVYHVLIDKETLERVLHQGLKEEHKKYKEKIVEFFMSMKDRIKVEDLRVY